MKTKKTRFELTIALIIIVLSVLDIANANEAIIKELEKEAKAIDTKFTGFNVARGEKLFRNERVNKNGEKISCMTCHTPDPKKEGLTRANKIIQPMAPVINPERFTDMAKVQKWFKRNCNDVLDRECTLEEKGDFAVFMMSIK